MSFKQFLKKYRENIQRGYDTQAGAFLTMLLSIIVVSLLYNNKITSFDTYCVEAVFGWACIGLILIIPDFLPLKSLEKMRKEFSHMDTSTYYYITYKDLFEYSFSIIILTPLILNMIFNTGKILSFESSMVSTLDSDLIIATTLLLIASEFLEHTYLEKARMFPNDYKKLIINTNYTYAKYAVLTLIFAILSLEILGANLNVSFGIFFMLIALYFIFYAFVYLLYIERLRTLARRDGYGV